MGTAICIATAVLLFDTLTVEWEVSGRVDLWGRWLGRPCLILVSGVQVNTGLEIRLKWDNFCKFVSHG